jgi:hypothetical protein
MSGRKKCWGRRLILVIASSIFMACLGSARAAGNTSPGDKTYTLGTVISFGAGGGADRFKVSGWSTPENQFTWTQDKGAKISVELPAVESALILRMKLVGLIHAPELASQPVELYVNGKKIADWQVAAPADFTAMIPQEVAAAKKLEIELRTPKSTTPKALKMNDDARVLGVACFEFEIKK